MDELDEYCDIIPTDAETKLVFFVNGKKVVEENPDPNCTLLWYLRKKLQLTGTKYGCGEGGCGACTVMLSQYINESQRVKHYAVNSCLTPLCAVHGLAITTVEGIGSTQTKLHAVQERLAKAHGSQCGFCTPGIVMSMYSLLRNKNKVNFTDIDTALQGNLCRCTGYRPIIEGFKTFMEGWETCYVNGTSEVCSMGDDCCRKNKGNSTEQTDLKSKSQFQPYDPTQEPIFPPELKLHYESFNKYLFYKAKGEVWIRPTNLHELLFIKQKYPRSVIVVGNTEVGIETKFKKMVYPIMISPSLIQEMKIFEISGKCITVGALTTLTDFESRLKDHFDFAAEDQSLEMIREIVEMLQRFAGKQIRNVASLAGNIMTASPISDLNPILMASGAILNVLSPGMGMRRIPIDNNFFISYRKTAIEDNETVISIEIPFTENGQYFKAFKQSRRKDDDISIVTSAFNLTIDLNNKIVKDVKICFGGMGPTTLFATETELFMKSKTWNDTLVEAILQKLTDEFELNESTPGGMAAYRKTLCLSFFMKFFYYVSQKIRGLQYKDNLISKVPISSQIYEISGNNRKVTDAVGLPIVHASAFKQATGEAVYCDDLPKIEGELYLALVFSKMSYAKIVSIDTNGALKYPGVVKFYSAADLDDSSNKIGPLICDEEVFSKHIVTSKACVIGAIVAESEVSARKAKDLIKVTYEQLDPVIVTLEDAIDRKSYYPGCPKIIKKGNIEQALQEADFLLEGYSRSGAQEHFYLETTSAFAIRREDEIEITISSQSPTNFAEDVSRILGIPSHKVITKVKRIGGGFGGKETRPFISGIPAAIAAYKLNRPVRTVLDRNEDMQSTGYRHPFLTKYKAAFNKDGKIIGAKFNIYCNAGCTQDLSFLVIVRASLHIDNTYFIPNIEVNAYACKTNLPSNTAFRGFGAPQGMFASENMIRDVANFLKKRYEEVAITNMYKEGDVTHFDQVLIRCTITRCWNECIEYSNYWKRHNNVEEFNRTSRWKKKGLAIVPTKFGISFGSDAMMKGASLVMIYIDGSVLISIGGIEMGQGLFTKMIQVASRALEVDISKIHISEYSTDKVPNSSPTAGSISSDLYGMAVIDACTKLKERLQPYKDKNPKGKWVEWVKAANEDRVNLSATGFYAAPKIQYNFDTNSGQLYEYFTYGVACSEVVIDCLTGDHQVLRTDIVMDIGESLNPAIDIGQIEGAFMQGYGFYTMEEIVYSPQGHLYTQGPGTYKIPGFSDIPREFNVSLLKGAANPRAVYASKAVGEPPLALAVSVFFAIKEAIRDARTDAKVDPNFVLDAPATCERIRMACEDNITKKVEPTVKKTGKPWSVVV